MFFFLLAFNGNKAKSLGVKWTGKGECTRRPYLVLLMLPTKRFMLWLCVMISSQIFTKHRTGFSLLALHFKVNFNIPTNIKIVPFPFKLNIDYLSTRNKRILIFFQRIIGTKRWKTQLWRSTDNEVSSIDGGRRRKWHVTPLRRLSTARWLHTCFLCYTMSRSRMHFVWL